MLPLRLHIVLYASIALLTRVVSFALLCWSSTLDWPAVADETQRTWFLRIACVAWLSISAIGYLAFAASFRHLVGARCPRCRGRLHCDHGDTVAYRLCYRCPSCGYVRLTHVGGESGS